MKVHLGGLLRIFSFRAANLSFRLALEGAWPACAGAPCVCAMEFGAAAEASSSPLLLSANCCNYCYVIPPPPILVVVLGGCKV